MAILTKIRNRSGLAIGVVGIALGLFVVSDALNSFSGGGGAQSNNVGEIDGENIGIKQFDDKLNYNLENFQKRTQNQTLDEATRGQVRDQTWNQMLNDYMMAKEYEQLGLNVSEEELADMIYGNNIHPQIKQSFTDPNSGMFDVNNVKRYLKQTAEGTDETAKAQWKEFEDFLITETLQRKYANLLKRSLYATSLEAKNLYTSRTQSSEVNFVALSYNTVADSTIKPEESDLKSYFKKNMQKYKERENSRKLEFLVWDFAPTSEDSAEVQKWAFDQVEQFKAADNDTAYVDLNSDAKFDANPKKRSEFPESVQARLFRDSVGTVVGPVFENGKYSLYKVTGIKQDSVFSMRASHILIRVEGATDADTTAAQKKANDVLGRIRKGEDFAVLAMEFGTDGTKEKGGDLGWFAEGSMVKEFNDAVKNGKKGDQFVLKTQFGFHVIKITEDKSKKLVCAGIVERSVGASEKTSTSAYNEASQFAASCKDADDFNKNLEEKKMLKRVAEFVRETDNFLPGYNDAREAIRWAFNAKEGSVSEVMTVGGDKYVIATLTLIREKGKANFDAAKDRVTADYIKDKKAEQLLENLKTAMDGATTLDAVSRKINQTVTPIAAQTFENASIPYVGFDNSFAGAICGTSEMNKLIGPFKGDAGVYAYQVNKVTPAPTIADYTQQKAELAGSLQQRVEYGYFEILKEMKNVVDHRFLFY
ncbi:MAG: SurA N-terminal domain-containing protein [bacterium]|nr:SurA N-terminal domain-containing protein [bacterium]